MSLEFRLARWQLKGYREKVYIDLAAAIENGESLKSQIGRWCERYEERKDIRRSVMRHWYTALDHGQPMSEAIRGTVPDSDLLLLAAAESAVGKDKAALPNGLRLLARTVRNNRQLRSVVIGAVIMPVLLMMMCLVFLLGYSYGMVPMLTKFADPATWHPMGRLMYAVARIITGPGPYLGSAALVMVILAIYLLPRWSGSVRRRVFDRLPPWSIYRQLNAATFFAALASLLQSQSMVSALNILSDHATPWLRGYINEMFGRMATTDNRGGVVPLLVGLANQDIEDRLQDYGEHKRGTEQAIFTIGIESMEEISASLKLSANIVNNILMAMAGTLILTIMLSIILTIWDASKKLRNNALSAVVVPHSTTLGKTPCHNTFV